MTDAQSAEAAPADHHAALVGQPVPASATQLLIASIHQKDLELCRRVVASNPEALHGADPSGATPMHWCALTGNAELLDWLLESGAPSNAAVAGTGMEPIHWAATRGHTEVVRRLLKAGADIDALDRKHTTALVIAAQYDHTVLVFFLCKAGADISLLDDCGDSALHWAAYKNNQQTFALLHYMGLPADKADEYGSTALHLAAAQGASAVVEYMIENVTEAEGLHDLKDKKGRTPLAVSREHSHHHAARLLQAARPTFLMRILKLVMGGDSTSVLFYFFWVNSWGAYLTYYLLFASHIGMYQNMVYILSNVLMYHGYLLSYTMDPGFVPTGGEQQKRYEEALLRASEGDLEGASQTPLCHTCHVVRPLRSKHCVISKRCVSTFDHFCPYVNNAMGARNYGYFVYFIVNGLVGNALQLAAAVQFAVFVSPYHPWAIVQVPRRPPRPPSSTALPDRPPRSPRVSPRLTSPPAARVRWRSSRSRRCLRSR